MGRSVVVSSTLAAMGIGMLSLRAEFLALPNASFESPSTLFVTTLVQGWEKLPKPADYDESGGFLWDQLVGQFKNTAPGAPDHLVNCDGQQAAYLFAVPQAGISLEPRAATGPDGPVVWEVGKAYRLTVAVLGGGGNMKEGVPLSLQLYYRDAQQGRVTLASTVVSHSAVTFPDRNHLTDFVVRVPAVRPLDVWAGQPLGIRIESTVGGESQGGYWDVDHVRLERLSEPVPRLGFQMQPGGLRLNYGTEVGYRYQLEKSSDLLDWTPVGEAAAGTGSGVELDLPTPGEAGSFRLRVTSIP
jgi:hypothetical protein